MVKVFLTWMKEDRCLGRSYEKIGLGLELVKDEDE